MNETLFGRRCDPPREPLQVHHSVTEEDDNWSCLIDCSFRLSRSDPKSTEVGTGYKTGVGIVSGIRSWWVDTVRV